MRYVIFGDIHGNLEALEAVMEKMANEKPDKYICIGDIVGYCANPNECIDRVLSLNPVIVAGNHDYAAIGILNVDFFNPYAFKAIEWTKEQLTAEHKELLGNLKLVQQVDNFTVVHSSPYNPEMFEYMENNYDVLLAINAMDTHLGFVGHSHIPMSFTSNKGHLSFSTEPYAQVKGNSKVIVNIGSVGQPRDENPEAAYAVYNKSEGVVWVKRVEYDIQKCADKILKANLPDILAERIKHGR
ncbi:MAG: metallophosphoesterase family protein [Planctomycetota bacterium]|nr:metallophosphoesterase family protein [Planctomycetota bacterium]MDI6786988.1 metallophosphoesterase family protein [Planctomycetota bacterium]